MSDLLTAETDVAPAGVAPSQRIKEAGRASGEGAPVADYGAPTGVVETLEVHVPDIGDFKDVPVIEVLVKSGDSVKADDSLVTLESDKATMEVPAPFSGVVKDLKVKVKRRHVKVNNAKVLKTNVDASNGVIHVIDSVFRPHLSGWYGDCGCC